MLTHQDKEDILNDYKIWSGGFTPDEMSPEDHKIYVECTLQSKYAAMSEYVLDWLNNYKGEYRPTADHTGECSSDAAVNKEAQEWIEQVAWQDDVMFSDVEKRYMLYAFRAGAYWGSYKQKKENKSDS